MPTISKQLYDVTLSSLHKAQLKQLCYNETVVKIAKNPFSSSNIEGKLVQYATLCPSNPANPWTVLYIQPEGKKLESVEWKQINGLSWKEVSDPSFKGNESFAKVKKCVARALQMPLPEDSNAVSQIIEAVSKGEISYEKIFSTVTYGARVNLFARIVSQLLRDGKTLEAKEFFKFFETEDLSPFYHWNHLPFAEAILGLVAAGIMTDPVPPEEQWCTMPDGLRFPYENRADFQRGIGFAIRETRKKALAAIQEDGLVSAADRAHISTFRQNEKVQRMADKLNILEWFEREEMIDTELRRKCHIKHLVEECDEWHSVHGESPTKKEDNLQALLEAISRGETSYEEVCGMACHYTYMQCLMISKLIRNLQVGEAEKVYQLKSLTTKLELKYRFAAFAEAVLGLIAVGVVGTEMDKKALEFAARSVEYIHKPVSCREERLLTLISEPRVQKVLQSLHVKCHPRL